MESRWGYGPTPHSVQDLVAFELFDRFIMISPALPPGAPTIRPKGGWASVALPRILVLAALNRVGIDWFNGLPIVAFATPPNVANLTSVYSFRLAIGFGAPRKYLARWAAARNRWHSRWVAATSCSIPIASSHCSGRPGPICTSRSCPASAISA
jgi:hypothetical protein